MRFHSEEIIMGSAIPLGECKEVMLDIESELQYWNRHCQHAAFHRAPRSFDQYLPTLKFGYDMYLLNRGQGLDELLPVIRARYEASMDRYRGLEWPLAEAIIRETWKRMRPEANHRANNHRQVLVGHQPTDPSPIEYHS